MTSIISVTINNNTHSLTHPDAKGVQPFRDLNAGQWESVALYGWCDHKYFTKCHGEAYKFSMNKCSKKTQNCLIANNFEIHINKFQIKYKMFYNRMLTTTTAAATTTTMMMSSQTGCANNPLIDSSHQAIATLPAREYTHTPCMTYHSLSLLSYRCEQKTPIGIIFVLFRCVWFIWFYVILEYFTRTPSLMPHIKSSRRLPPSSSFSFSPLTCFMYSKQLVSHSYNRSVCVWVFPHPFTHICFAHP